jgi:hypothetical protein
VAGIGVGVASARGLGGGRRRAPRELGLRRGVARPGQEAGVGAQMGPRREDV